MRKPHLFSFPSFASLIMLLGLTASCTTSPSFAEPPAPPPPSTLPLESRRVIRELNLTDDQLLQIRNLRQKQQEESGPLRNQLRQKQEELQTMLAGNSSPEQLRTKHQEIDQLRRKMSQMQFEQALAIREILTPTQRQRLAEIIRSRPRRPQRRE